MSASNKVYVLFVKQKKLMRIMVRVMLSITLVMIRVTETFHKMGSIKLILTMVISPVLQETARNVDHS